MMAGVGAMLLASSCTDAILLDGVSECLSPEDCEDDGNECTQSLCTDGMCERTPVADGTECSSGDECRQGECAFIFPCTEQGIRSAIAEGGGPHYFACTGQTTIPLESTIVIDNDVVLDGEGELTVDGQELHGVFEVPDSATAELRGFAITRGRRFEGGGVFNSGVFTLTDSTVSDCAAVAGAAGVLNTGTMQITRSAVSNNMVSTGLGGGITNVEQASMTLTDSLVSGNSAGLEGGGILNAGTLSVIDSNISGNNASGEGGGIYCRAGEATLTNTEISENEAVRPGGGARLLEGASMTLIDSTVSDNTALSGGGIDSGGTLSLVNSSVSGNTAASPDAGRGGGIASGGPLTLVDSTVTENVAPFAGGLFIIESTAELQGTTVSANESGSSGGGIVGFSNSELILTNSTVTDNTAAGGGGGIQFQDLTLVDSRVSNNTAGGRGGGIAGGFELSVLRSTIEGNSAAEQGGGIAYLTTSSVPSDVTVTETAIIDNVSSQTGGGIFHFRLNDNGWLLLERSVVSGNQATDGAGIYNDGEAGLSDTTISNNIAADGPGGGGIYNLGQLSATRCTLSANQASGLGGAGILNSGELQLVNVTVSGNSASDIAGGINNNGADAIMELTNVTLAGNSSMFPSSAFFNSGTMRLDSSIISGRCSAFGTVISRGNNIESPGNTCGLDQGSDRTEVTGAQLNLGPLSDNGGLTETHALNPGSIAIDAIPSVMGVCVLVEDQRSLPRPQGPACDVGSVEVGE